MGYGGLFLFLTVIFVFLFFHGSLDHEKIGKKWYFVGPIKKIFDDLQSVQEWYSEKEISEIENYFYWGIKISLFSFLWSKKVRQEIFAHRKILFSLAVGVFLLSIASLSYWDHEGHLFAKFLDLFLFNLFYAFGVYVAGIIPLLAVAFVATAAENYQNYLRAACLIPIFFLIFNWGIFQMWRSVPYEDGWCDSYTTISNPKECNYWASSSLSKGQKIIMNEEAFPKRLTFKKAPTMFLLCGSNTFVFNYYDERIFSTGKTKIRVDDLEEHLDFSLSSESRQIVLTGIKSSELGSRLLKSKSMQITFNANTEKPETWVYRTGFLEKYLDADLTCVF